MSENEQPIEWYLARDGNQHGPVTDLEMQKIVELGHLRPADLVWRQGMPEWVQASAAFPPVAQKAAAPAAQPVQPQAQIQPVPHQPAQQASAPHPVQTAAAPQPQAQAYVYADGPQQQPQSQRPPAPDNRQSQPATPAATAIPVRGPNPAQRPAPQSANPHTSAPQDPDPRVLDQRRPDQRAPDQRAPDQRGQRDVRAALAAAQWDRPVQAPQRPQQQASGIQPSGPQFGQTVAPQGQIAPRTPAPQSYQAPIPAPLRPTAANSRPPGTLHAQPPAGMHAGGGHGQPPQAAVNPGGMRQPPQPQLPGNSAAQFDDLNDSSTSRRRFPVKTVAALLLLCGLGGGAFALHKTGLLPLSLPFMTGSENTSVDDKGDKAVAKMRAASAATKEPPLTGFGSTPETVSGELQKSTLWQVVKREFPAWYEERVQDAVRLAGEKKDDKEISAFMTAALIDLRRKNGVAVLASSPQRLKMVAASFVENLSRLAKHSTEACYGYISQGEGSPVIMELLRTTEHTSSLQAQFKAIIEAAADGRKSPKSYRPPSREDYDVLAAQLQARGWTPVDLQTFSDAKALARATPERVCQMVQDWFLAQLAVNDEDAQMRLLAEALKPVVSG